MPQLMPLPWIFSCFMVLFLVCMMSALYSKYTFCLSGGAEKSVNQTLLWLW